MRSNRSPFWNAIPAKTVSVLSLCVTVSFRCFLFPTAREYPESITFSVRNTGDRFPGPKGANCLRIRTNLGVMLEKSILMSTFSYGISSSSSRCSDTYCSKRSENFSRFSGFNDRPAAYLCPPKCSSKSEQLSMAS